MSMTALITLLDNCISDEKILVDLTQLIWKECDGKIEFQEDVITQIPRNTVFKIITKAFFKEYYQIGYSTGYKVIVSIGDIKNIEFGIPTPEYGFATLYFNEAGQLFTQDFHEEFR